MAKDAAVAFRVSDDDLEIIDEACRIQMSLHPGSCSRNDIYRHGGLVLAKEIVEKEKARLASMDNLEAAA